MQVQRRGAYKRELSPSEGNTIAEMIADCGSAGGEVAIMLALYEVGELWAGIHSTRCLGQGCKRTPKKEGKAGKHHEGCLLSISWGFYAVALNVQV
jgi:hypothetical protein